MEESEKLTSERKIAAALKKLRVLEMRECINPFDLTSRPHSKQQEVLDGIVEHLVRVVRAGNRGGKSAIGGREASWIFDRTHPFLKLPEHPLLLLVIGKTFSYSRLLQRSSYR
jgi:hypothetical protein